MPAKSPLLDGAIATLLSRLGQEIRAQRKLQKVSATTAAEAAGMARVTLHRIERGEPSVTMGAYLAALAAMGLRLHLSGGKSVDVTAGAIHAQEAARTATETATEPATLARVRLADYPQLERLAWHMHAVDDISAEEALSLYERNWRHVDQAALSTAERRLLHTLAASLGGGRMLV